MKSKNRAGRGRRLGIEDRASISAAFVRGLQMMQDKHTEDMRAEGVFDGEREAHSDGPRIVRTSSSGYVWR